MPVGSTIWGPNTDKPNTLLFWKNLRYREVGGLGQGFEAEGNQNPVHMEHLIHELVLVSRVIFHSCSPGFLTIGN